MRRAGFQNDDELDNSTVTHYRLWIYCRYSYLIVTYGVSTLITVATAARLTV